MPVPTAPAEHETTTRSSSSPSVIVVGLQSLSLAVIRHLVADGIRVVVSASPQDLGRHRDELESLGVEMSAAGVGSAARLTAAGLATAAAVILTDDDDALNVDFALGIRRLRKDVPLLVRIFDRVTREYLHESIGDVRMLSIGDTAAKEFATLALATFTEHSERVIQRRIHARRWWLTRPTFDRVLLLALLCHFMLVGVATLYFSYALDLSPVDAMYFVASTVTTVGYGDISLRQAHHTAKFVGMFLMFVGTALVAVMLAFFTGWVVDRRLDVLRGRVPVRRGGHVVIGGAGDVGYRVAELLKEQHHRVVVVERDASSRNVEALRSDGCHVIIGNLSVDESLNLAAVDCAAAVVAVTNSDSTNLEVALKVRKRNSSIPVVIRLVSPELSHYVTDRRDAIARSPVEIAATAFVEEVQKILREGRAI